MSIVCLSFSDVFLPEFRVVANKISHQLYTLGVIGNFELDAAGSQVWGAEAGPYVFVRQ